MAKALYTGTGIFIENIMKVTEKAYGNKNYFVRMNLPAIFV